MLRPPLCIPPPAGVAGLLTGRRGRRGYAVLNDGCVLTNNRALPFLVRTRPLL